MLISILTNAQYLQAVVFSFDKGLNRQNHSSSYCNHPIKKIFSKFPANFSFPYPLTLFGKTGQVQKLLIKSRKLWLGSFKWLNPSLNLISNLIQNGLNYLLLSDFLEFWILISILFHSMIVQEKNRNFKVSALHW